MLARNDAFTDATYNPEDNKLRLFTDVNIEDDLFSALLEQGFLRVPAQKCFMAAWTPQREDMCISLVGPVNLDTTSRLYSGVAENSPQKPDRFALAAQRLNADFNGQHLILHGHPNAHTVSRSAPQLDTALSNAKQAADMVMYWEQRLLAQTQNRGKKPSADQVVIRIQKLLAELRRRQNWINHGIILVELWQQLRHIDNAKAQQKQVEYYLHTQLKTGEASRQHHLAAYQEGRLSVDQIITQNIEWGERIATGSNTLRWITHILNRLSYEREKLGNVACYKGNVTANVITEFARAQGTQSPTAKHYGDTWTLSSPVTLPVHIANAVDITLSGDEWRTLFVELGYVVPDEQSPKPALLNFEAQQLHLTSKAGSKWYTQIRMTKQEFAALHSDHRSVYVSACGTFRVKVCREPGNVHHDAPWYCVFLTDNRMHAVPDSTCIKQQ
ncbi:hypothetical protein [Alteromonas macleodii]|uniref:Uncharacterized protein n=1 Tax=Alteromonas macleodii TaxID=28108 RepID=A0AB36FQJ6_ALTMA|nr:hypothetical protein [Alteromonas macleodii]OES24039.1 hypothetical protein BFV95_4878 [Alteromonas macleodii]OES25368.1 hypothetical protein BFV93_4472 [Alteromonas macleodii]OES25717.1 hypothetical protein BFV94_4324 [Alteromonas macleodii]OES38605.1 hypothetical protein BFV96_4716 [Alteromonas macleodii]